MKGVLILLAVLSSSACFAKSECLIQEQVTVDGKSSFKTTRKFGAKADEVYGVPGTAIVIKSVVEDGKKYTYAFFMDAGVRCVEEEECGVMGYIRGAKFDKYSNGDDRLVSDLPQRHSVDIQDGEEKIYNLVSGNKTTTLKIACFK